MKKSLMNNIGLKLLAFLFAFLLWLIVVNVDDPVTDETFTGIVVTVEHEEVITEDNQTYQIVDDTQTVDVTVNARRSVLNRIKSEDIIATADMKELYLESQIPVDIQIPGYDYESAVSNPRNLQVKIEENASKTFPITPATVGTVRDGYVLGELRADPEKVTINGPQSVIEQINRVIAEVNVSGLSQDTVLDSELAFYDADNNVIAQSLLANNLGNIGVSVRVKLLHTKRIPIKIDTSSVTAASGYSVAGIDWTPQEILVAGEEDILEDINTIYVPAFALDENLVTKKIEKTIDISEYLPEDVKLVEEAGNNIVVTITVEKDGTKSFSLPVGSITVKNLNEKFKMSYGGTDDLEIHIRGPQEILDAISIEKMTSIDLADLTEAGEYQVPVKIELPQDCSLEGTVAVDVVLEEK